jgi:hypothetical protein
VIGAIASAKHDQNGFKTRTVWPPFFGLREHGLEYGLSLVAPVCVHGRLGLLESGIPKGVAFQFNGICGALLVLVKQSPAAPRSEDNEYSQKDAAAH